MPSLAHEQMIAIHCHRDGWSCGGFLAEVYRRLNMEPWRSDGYFEDPGFHANDDVFDLIRELHFLPDAFRFRIEGRPKWGHPVLVLEVLEVVNTHPVGLLKIEKFEELWWRMDASERLHFRAFETYGHLTAHVEPIMNTAIAHMLVGRRSRALA